MGTTANCTGLTNGTFYIFAVYTTNAIGNGPAANSNPVTPSSPIQVTIATGAYSDGSTPRPFLALNKDAGTTWTFPETITAPVFTPNNTHPFHNGSFSRTSCAGTTWTYPEAITAPVFTPNNIYPFNNGYFNGATGFNGLLYPKSLHFLSERSAAKLP